jgi:hypothetical protein
LLVAATAAVAQDDIQVNSADPDTTEQGTVDLEVMVGGANFPSDPKVDFFVTGTCDFSDPNCTGDPGGITVKKAKRQGPKNIKVTLNVAEEAQTELKFDIRVQSLRGGRSGKGTELFAVTKKEHPNQDTTPPGAPVDLHVTEETWDIVSPFNTVSLKWTMPADDDYDPASGRVTGCRCSVDGGSYSYSDCGICLGTPAFGPWGLPWPAKGEYQTCIPTNLEEDTTYLYSVRCLDEVANWSSEAQVTAHTRPFSEFRDPSWTIEEVTIGGAPVQFDAVAGHGYKTNGEVVIGGAVGLWDQVGKGRFGLVPILTRFITGNWEAATGSWVWRYGDYEDLSNFAGRLHMDPQGQPVLEGAALVDAKTQTHDLVYAYHNGSEWQSEVIATEAGSSRWRPAFQSPRGFAFDPDGNPAIAWCANEGAGGPRLARRDAFGQWTVEQVSQDECTGGWSGGADLAFDDAENPAVSYVRYVEYPNPYETKVAIWSGQQWVEEIVCRGRDFPEGDACSHLPRLAFIPRDLADSGYLTAVAEEAYGEGMLLGCDRLGPGDWQCTPQVLGALCEYGIPNHVEGGSFNWSNLLVLDDSRELFVMHSAVFGPGFAFSRRPLGQSAWTQEYVSHPTLHGLPSDVSGCGAVALDPIGSPTLAWDANVGERPATEYHLYFAWKATP